LTAYYNENDAFSAAWLRLLIEGGHIAQGDVDERSIVDVQPDDLKGYDQCHFFAGIGIWSYALRCAGWPDDRRVWTGSCPCQPFSAAGQRKGFDDARHLWPHWFRLIRECRPESIFGEQVDKALLWLDLVSGDMEGEGYAVGAAVLGAHSVGAPHIRQRLYFVAKSEHMRLDAGGTGDGRAEEIARSESRQITVGCSGTGVGLADANGGRCEQRNPCERGISESGAGSELGDSAQRGFGMRGSAPGSSGRLAFTKPSGVAQGDTKRERLEGHSGDGCDGNESRWLGEDAAGPVTEASILGGFWRDAEWLWCRDGKYRPVEPGTFPLVTRYPNRVGTLRGYGNALCAPQAQAFIEAAMEALS
jgi:DNA (cytosine-5)-methyltransferase 1